MLDKQISIYSVDTSNFYSKHEARLHNKINTLSVELNGYSNKKNRQMVTGINDRIKQLEQELNNCPDTEKEQLLQQLRFIKKHKNKTIETTKEKLLTLLSNKVQNNIDSGGKDHIRELHESSLSDSKNIINIFESSLIRSMGLNKDEFSDNLIVVQVFYFDVIKDLIYHGFTFKGEKYIYYTSSAGQIRTKKCVFIKESVWKELEKTVMCGLTLETINNKGGNNINKHLAYIALSNSATDVWEDFDIDRSIVIDDFETDVVGTYDFVDDTDFSIHRVENGSVTITHTDGAGMILPKLSNKNFMVRLPWIKGLLGVFDFKKFIVENNCSPIIKDIYGQEHHIFEENIQIIFTKSQFKLYKFYQSWDEYKTYYKQYNCHAGYCNKEEDHISNSSINYQMLQTLTDMSDEEIHSLTKPSVNTLNKLCDSLDNILDFLGVNDYMPENASNIQKALKLYPELINDPSIKIYLKHIKDSMIHQYKSGKLKINGKYTFILPDYYAACEYWFGHIDNPKGLLADQEVYCKLFKGYDKLDCLRSPHLYIEHAVRNNVANYKYGDRVRQLREWFVTNGLYTSTKDMISKILQFDDH